MSADTKPEADNALKALDSLVKAWDALPGGQYHSPWEVEEWLKRQMGPAVSRARKALQGAEV